MTLSIKYKLQTCFNKLLCILLYIKHSLFKKRLEIRSFLYTNKIVICGNKTELHWEINGCYKIRIEGLALIPGNTSSISVLLKKTINPLEIIFYGIQGQKQTKHIVIKTSQPKLKNTFLASSVIPNLTSTIFYYQKLKPVSTNSVRLRKLLKLDITRPKIIPNRLKAKHHPFNKFNYPIKS
jgi:hypothetical protein